MYNGNRITIVIPAYNEEQSISQVVKEIPFGIVDRVIVVDNGSSDRTRELAEKAGAEVVAESRRGYGAACLKGIEAAPGTDILVIMDADKSDHPDQVTRLLEPIAGGRADMVLGSRVLGLAEKGAMAPQAYWGNKLAVFLIYKLFGFKYTDMGPFRALWYKSLKEMRMEDKGFGWNAEMQIKAIKNGLRILEVPVDYNKRIGKSKISGTLKGTISAGSKIIYTILKMFYNSKR